MKKKIIFLLVFSACVLLFFICRWSNTYYNVKVTGSKDKLLEPLKSSYRAGTTIKIKSRPITEASLHVFVNNVEIPMNYSSVSKCWECKVVMPKEDITIHLTTDPFYGRDEYEFDELCSDLYNLENEITKVAIKTTDVTDKTNFTVTKYSSKQEDVDDFKTITRQRMIKVDNSITLDVTTQNEIQFYSVDRTNDEAITTLYFMDNYYQWTVFGRCQDFRFENESYVLPTIENPDLVTYSFQYDGLSSDVKRYDDESFSLKYFSIDSVEFIPYVGPEIDIEPTFYLDSRYGKINLLTSTVFELDGVFYEIISNADLWAYFDLQLENR